MRAGWVVSRVMPKPARKQRRSSQCPVPTTEERERSVVSLPMASTTAGVPTVATAEAAESDQHSDPHELQWSMDQLPKDVLLEVLQHLPVVDLLKCRRVCKRLGELALHPTVWRRKVLLSSSGGFVKLFCPVLRLAPCLNHLKIESLSPYLTCDHSLSTTRCGVEHLALSVGCSDALKAALVLQRQEVLGRLRRLTIALNVRATSLDKDQASILYRTLALTSRLESLVVTMSYNAGPVECSFAGIHVPSSLKSVEFNPHGQEQAENLVNFMLSTHAATLETARFHDPVSTSTLQLLAGLPRLRELTCRLQAGLEVLAASESLQVLTIRAVGDTEAAEATAAESLLRQARQLRQVSLECGYGAHSYLFPEALVRALAAEGTERSHLEKLSVACMCKDIDDLGEVLLGVLPGLPALQELDLSCPKYERLLRGLTPATAPALRRLTVRACAHDWTHRPSVKGLLEANPSLQVWSKWPRCASCHACKLACHRELGRTKSGSQVCLALKEELSICPSVHNQ
ncbi:uncharacterized protein LOC113204629 isoform X2 [Frankliniella occidentalis]|uniref:Uncharacterized protein LOC113204629 isoform X2 n=1 Tax=Frankliniella occidentalis TaxID=133901 RepID=A0A6J1S8S3_FRAOC|nr:uncharacterized protein LOC113204629 isoform X2 [Frankliniella occidentalis]